MKEEEEQIGRVEKVDVHLKVDAYFTPDGRPTCMLNMQKNQVCPYLRMSRMGTRFHCIFDEDNGRVFNYNDDDPREYLMPCSRCCIIHKQKEFN